MPRPNSTTVVGKRKVKHHPYNDLYLGLATTTGKARNAVKAFYNEPKSERNPSKKYEGYTLVIPDGDKFHENVFFIRQEKKITPARQTSNFHRIRVYDSTPNRNVPVISERFATTFQRREILCYSDSLHKIINWDGRCFHYVWLEVFLNFDLCQNLFDRNVRLCEIRKYKGMGHHGPKMHNPHIPYVRSKRDRSHPENQLDATEE